MTTPAPARTGSLQTLCALVLAAIACFRALVAFEPFPWWNTDPFESYSNTTGVTPAFALWLDVAAILISTAGLAAYFSAGGRSRRLLLGVLGLGVLGAMVWNLPGSPLESSRLAFAWVSVLWSVAALAHLCDDARRRTLAIALLLGIVGMLAAKGVVQVLVEHPDTVAWYERDRESFLRAQGWEPGSAQARGYERRLSQGEATGWFGLSNIYATVVAGSTVGLVAMLAVAGREWWGSRGARGLRLPAAGERLGPRSLVALAIGVVVGAIALYLCRSKGGMAAAAGGAGVFALIWSLAPRLGHLRRLAAFTAIALAALPILAVVARGLIGERIAELSLLFRWFYMQGAARIIADHPLVGVGPAGFRDAYLLAKPPLAVEDVTSPHCFPLDLLSAYGALPGVAAYAAIVFLVAAAAALWWRAALGQADAASTFVSKPPRDSDGATLSLRASDDAKLLALLAILITVPATYLERSLSTPETAGLRLVGLALWIAISLGILGVARRSPRALAAGAFAAAAVLLLHSGIEMTPGWIGAQTWFFALLGVVGAQSTAECASTRHLSSASDNPPSLTTTRPTRAPRLVLSVLILASLITLALAPWRILAWQAALHDAWTHASVVGRVRDELRVLESDPALAVELRITHQGVRQSVADMLSTAPAASPAEFERQLNALLARHASAAEAALAGAPSNSGIQTARATDRASQRLAGSHLATLDFDTASQVIARAIDRTASDAARVDSAVGWNHLASLWVLRASLEDQAGRTQSALAMRRAALANYAKAAALDPGGVYHPVRAARLAASIRDSAEASRWAVRAIENDGKARLDPLMGLSDAERAEMRALAAGPLGR